MANITGCYAAACALAFASVTACGSETNHPQDVAGGSADAAGAAGTSGVAQGGSGGVAQGGSGGVAQGGSGGVAQGGSGGVAQGGSGGSAGQGGYAGVAGTAGGGCTTQGFEPDPACYYQDHRLLAFSCSGAWRTGFEMQSTVGGSACPDYVKTQHQAVVDTACLEALGCDASCVYTAIGAALILYCDLKGEIVFFEDGGPLQTTPPGSCPEIYHYVTVAGSGWYASQESFENDNPCP